MLGVVARERMVARDMVFIETEGYESTIQNVLNVTKPFIVKTWSQRSKLQKRKSRRMVHCMR
jgi:hypothetical protein